MAVNRRIEGHGLPRPAKITINELARLGHVATEDRAGTGDRPVLECRRPDQPALPAEKDRGLIQHDPPGDIAKQGCRGLVLLRRKIEVHVRRAHFAVA